MLVHVCNNLAVPKEFTPDFVQRVINFTSLANVQQLAFNRVAQLSIGPVLQDILGFMDDKVTGKSSPDFVLLSGHDQTISPTLSVFDALGPWPPYASLITWELYSANKTSGTPESIRMVFNGKIVPIPSCSKPEFCPFSEFKAFMESNIPSEDDCKAPAPSPPSPSKGTGHNVPLSSAIGGAVACIVLGIAIGILAARWYFSRQSSYAPLN
eukprot:m.74595 g.74595  ORF g.74595 m.74595 type:complete len:211 (-) comp8061_c0_seq2:47-679(-)